MRKRLSTAAALVAAFTALALIPASAMAKTCSSGYVHAVIGGAQKCLHGGEYCSRSEASQYRRYGYACVSYGGGVYRLRSS